MTDLWIVFLTGLTVGGFSCMAVQGGLLASVIASREENDLESGKTSKHNLWPVAVFLISKLVAYTLLGFLLGLFGSSLELSNTAKIIIQILAGVYMILVAFNLLNLHPIFRYVVIQPPKFLVRVVKNQSKSQNLFAPAFLGALTIFIPCGTTLAIEVLAISSGSPLAGALIMAAFVLGTSPLFFGLGFLTTVLGDALKTKFFKVAAILIIYLGLVSINSGFLLAGWSLPIEINLNQGVENQNQVNSNVRIENGVQVADIQVYPSSYNPDLIQVKVNQPVKLNLISSGGYGCTSAFVIPSENIGTRIPRGGSTFVEFTPSKVGKINWTCSMGMYYGTLDVISDK